VNYKSIKFQKRDIRVSKLQNINKSKKYSLTLIFIMNENMKKYKFK